LKLNSIYKSLARWTKKINGDINIAKILNENGDHYYQFYDINLWCESYEKFYSQQIQ
jgi:hypothetical protein